MEAVRKKSSEQLQPFYQNQQGTKGKCADIYQLIETIPTSIVGNLFKKEGKEHTLILTERLLNHVTKHYPNQVANLEFDADKDHLNNLIYQLSEILFKDGKTIQTEENETTLTILTPLHLQNDTFYTASLSWMDAVEATPLKIAIAHLLNQFYKLNFTEIKKEFFLSPFSRGTETEELYMCYMEDDDNDEEVIENLKAYRRKGRRYLKQFSKYREMELNLENYNPRTKRNQTLKKHLQRVIDNPLDLVRTFPRISNGDTDGFDFECCYELFIDVNDKYCDKRIMSSARDFPNCGVSPMGAYQSYTDKGYSETNPNTIKGLKRFHKSFCKIARALNNN